MMKKISVEPSHDLWIVAVDRVVSGAYGCRSLAVEAAVLLAGQLEEAGEPAAVVAGLPEGGMENILVPATTYFAVAAE